MSFIILKIIKINSDQINIFKNCHSFSKYKSTHTKCFIISNRCIKEHKPLPFFIPYIVQLFFMLLCPLGELLNGNGAMVYLYQMCCLLGNIRLCFFLLSYSVEFIWSKLQSWCLIFKNRTSVKIWQNFSVKKQIVS